MVAEGTYRKYGLEVTIKMGGPQVNGLQLLVGGQTDLFMGTTRRVSTPSSAACRS